MFLFSRYTFIFLVSLVWLSKIAPSQRFLGELSSFEIWGNNAELYISDGKPSITFDGNFGGGGFFLTPAGRCIFYCFGECHIQLFLPKSVSLSVFLDEGKVYVDNMSNLFLQQRIGETYLRNVEKSKLFLYQGTVDVLVPENGLFQLFGQKITGEIFSAANNFSYFVSKKGLMERSEQDENSESVMKLQYFEGHVVLLKDSLVKDFDFP